MTKVLNIDGLKKEPNRALTIAGKQFFVREMSVGDFIKINDLAQKFDAKEEVTAIDHVVFLVESILMSVPECPRELLEQCSFDQLKAISDFIKDGSVPEQMDEQEGVEKKSKQANPAEEQD